MRSLFTDKALCWLLFAVTLYVFYFYIALVLRFHAFSLHDFDLAAYDQVLWKLTRGERFSSILGIDFLGQHAHFLAFPLAFFYSFFPDPTTALLFQTTAVAWGAVPLFLIARHRLDSSWALIIGLIYLLYPALGFVTAFEFHFPPFAIPLLLYMFYYFMIFRYRAFVVCMCLVLLCQENFALAVFTFGLLAAVWKRDWKWWLPALAGSLVCFLFYVKVLVPRLNPGFVDFISIYTHWGESYSAILWNLLTHPVEVAVYLFSFKKLLWLVQLFAPLLFIPLIGGAYLIPALPLFLQHMLSNRVSETMIIYHYTAELIPFIFIAFVFGLGNLQVHTRCVRSQKLIKQTLLVMAVFAMLVWGPHRFMYEPDLVRRDDFDNVKESFLRLVPADAPVLATFQFLPRLTHRNHLYSFHHLYSGHYTLSSKAYVIPVALEYALLDMNDPLTFGSFYSREGAKRVRDFLKDSNMQAAEVRDNLVLFKKMPAESKNSFGKLFEVGQDAVPESAQTPLFADGAVVLQEIGSDRRKDVLRLRFSWRSQKRTCRDVSLLLSFLDQNAESVSQLVSPVCYRIFPTSDWSAGQLITEYKNLTIPSALSMQSFRLRIEFFEETERKVLETIELDFIKEK